MSSSPPVTAPAPTSPPSNSTSPPPPAVSPPPTNSTSPPTPAVSPPPTNSTSPPPPAAAPPPLPPVQAPPPVTPTPPATAPPPATPTPPATAPPPATTPPVTPTPPATTPPPERTPSPPATTPPPSRTPTPPAPRTPSTPPSAPSPPARGNSPPVPPPPSGGRPSTSPPPPPSSGGSSGITTGVVVGIAIGGVLILVVLSCLFIFCKKKKRRVHEPADHHYAPPSPPPPAVKADPQWQRNAPPPADHFVAIPPKPSPPPQHPPHISSSGASSNYTASETGLPPTSPGMSLGFSKSTFTYEELVRATDGFSNANLLGQGGFGYVHKGVLPNGKEVAVKQLKAGSGQGEREFQAEVEIISRVHHKHLVSLVGYCITGSQRLLVYEFVPNNTLEFHLHGKGRPPLDWPLRVKIALGSAKGLAYLHEDCQPKIIHRDIKAANILIDFNFEAKVADFGLAKLTSDLNTHVSTRVMGTFGYMAPEYASSGKLTEKSDVFSYGVMLLELITGRRPVDSSQTYMDDSLVDWARPLLTRALEDDKFDDALVDRRLENGFNHNEMARMVACAAACVRHSAKRRPRMSQVVRALEGDVSLADLNEGIKPGQSAVYSSYGSSDYDTLQYNEDMRKFRKMALATSQEYGSSDQYSNPTSEYGLNPSGSSSEGHHTREMETKKDSKGFSGSS